MAYREIVTKDFGWKFFSVLLAVVVWLIVHAISEDFSGNLNPLHRMATRTFEHVPVDIVFAAADVREIKIAPEEVQVTVTGRADAVNFLDEKEIRVTVDLRGIEEAQNLRKRVMASAPLGVTIIGIIPREVDVVVPAKGLPLK